jgi:hypothetical protein
MSIEDWHFSPLASLLLCIGYRTESEKLNKMNKYYLVVALAAFTSLAQANTCTVLNTVSLNNNGYNCNLTPALGIGSGLQVTDCTFTFNNCSLTSWGGGLLYCNIGGVNIGKLTKTATSWVCTLDTTGLNTLNSCITAGYKCDFDVTCSGGWKIGGCVASYTCNPVPKSVPDAASTAGLLSFGVAGVSLLRRKLV